MKLYHRTTETSARALCAGEPWLSKEHAPQGQPVFFSDRASGNADGYGDACVLVEVPAHLCALNDEFPNGEKHYVVLLKDLRGRRVIRPRSNPADSADPADRRKMRGRALGRTGTVTIYRACASTELLFRPMDFVTQSLRFAKGHAEHSVVVDEEDQHVLCLTAKRSLVFEAPNSGEYFYDGPEILGRVVHTVRANPANPDVEPIVLRAYHGGRSAITRFDKKHIGSNTGAGWLGDGFYFSPYADAARSYGPVITEVELRLENPFRFPDDENPIRWVKDHGGGEVFTRWVKDQGYDGIISETVLHQIVVFEPDQIRIIDSSAARANPGVNQGVEPIVRIFNELIASAPAGSFPKPVRLVVDDKTARAGRTEKRATACTDGDTVFIVRALCSASEARMTGVLAHELAHVSLMNAGQPDHTERAADAFAEDLWGFSIGYDAEDVQTTDQHAQRPRPARLDRPDIKGILRDPKKRKEMMVGVIQATQAREGIETSREQAEAAYDKARTVRTKRPARPAPKRRRNPTEDGEYPWSVGLHDTKVGDTTIGYFISELEPDVIKISSVRTPQLKRGSGSARRALEAFLVETDLRGFTVQLCSSPLDKKTRGDKLLRFYRSLGFVPTGATCNYVGDLWLTRAPLLVTNPAGHGVGCVVRLNPSATAALASSIEDVSGDNFEEHFGEDPEEVREQGEVRHGRRVIWVGSPGAMIEVDRNYVVPIQGNQFNTDKLAAVAEATRTQSGPSQSGKPVLFVGYGSVMIIDKALVEEGIGNEADEVPLERDLDASDIGKLLYTVRDGNHRTFGALIGGETKVWMNLERNQLQDVEQWRSKKMPEHLSKNKAHRKLMKLLDAKLRDD